MSKIITLTANTAIDCFIEVPQLNWGGNFQAASSSEFAGGKGLNAAKALVSLQEDGIHALGFCGTNAMQRFNLLSSSCLSCCFLPIRGETRRNITLLDSSRNLETQVRTSGFRVGSRDCMQLKQTFAELLAAGDTVLLSGSLPPGAPPDFYADLIHLIRERGAFSILDSSGEPLREAWSARPDCIKPNLAELEGLLDRPLQDQTAVVQVISDLHRQFPVYIVVSMGASGLLAINPDGQLLKANIPKLPRMPVSTLGCGDSLAAGLAVGLRRNVSWPDILKLAVVSATANLFSIEAGAFDSHWIDVLRPLVVTEVLKIQNASQSQFP